MNINFKLRCDKDDKGLNHMETYAKIYSNLKNQCQRKLDVDRY